MRLIRLHHLNRVRIKRKKYWGRGRTLSSKEIGIISKTPCIQTCKNDDIVKFKNKKRMLKHT